MRAIIYSIVAACVLDTLVFSTLANGKIVKPQRAIDQAEIDKDVRVGRSFESGLRNFILGWKGLLAGYQKGFYGDERIQLSEDCFGSDKIQEDLIFMDKFLNGELPPPMVIKFVTTASDLIDS